MLLWRAIRLRCPNCGGHRLFRHWLSVRDFCPTCGLWIEREPGFYTGAIAMNLVASELTFVLGLAVWILLTWPSPPWDTLRIAAPLLVCALPLLFWPFSKTIWLALSLWLHPTEWRDVVGDYRSDPSSGG